MTETDWPEGFAELSRSDDLPAPPTESQDAGGIDPEVGAIEEPHVWGLIAGSAVGQRMVQIALSQRGVAESGGQNRGIPFERYCRPFGFASPIPWCACFVSWCYWQTAGTQPQWPNPAYVGSVYNWARGAGQLTRQPSQGDMFGISDTHMGLVAARLRNGRILTIEGNWGDRVLSRELAIGSLWFATPTYP